MVRIHQYGLSFLLVAWTCCATQVCAARQPEIVVCQVAGKMQVVVRGTSIDGANLTDWATPQWQRLLSVAVDNASTTPPPAILGSYEVAAGEIRFRPRFAFRPGVAYRVIFDPAALNSDRTSTGRLTHKFTLDARANAPVPVVQAIYPSADRLPENLLKFYLQFSTPMRQGVAFDHVRLLRGDRTVVEDPFVDVGQELWDRTGTRLTLLLDPGRVKRGIRPHEEVGPVLVAGEEYMLEIDRHWKNSSGLPLTKNVQKRFAAVSFDRQPPAPNEWKLVAPSSGTNDRLVVDFNEPMDYALAQHSLEIIGPNGKTVLGNVEIGKLERQWVFAPQESWRPGTYKLRIDGRFEDIAAHSVGRPFELDIHTDGTTAAAKKLVTLNFVVR